ncbi:cytochrome P450 [Gongronella butleri]|nr:cytochrome P450 [Gongronella butleri]
MVLQVGSELKPKPWLEPFPAINRIRMWWIGRTSSVPRRHREQLHNALAPEVARRLKAMTENDSNWERPDDVLQSILENEKPPAGVSMVDYLVAWFTSLIFAAIHTTSENSTVFIYRLLQHPELVQDLYEEQNEILQKHGYDASVGPEVFTREILNEFVKMDSAIRETARARHTYYGLPHTNTSNRTIVLSSGARILPGENAFIDFWSCHRDPEMQSVIDDYNAFKPYRYLNQGKNATKIGDDFLFFGLGKHACPGRWFAIQEIKTIIALLLRKYELSSPDEVIFPIAEREPFPPYPTRITFKPRQAPMAA